MEKLKAGRGRRGEDSSWVLSSLRRDITGRRGGTIVCLVRTRWRCMSSAWCCVTDIAVCTGGSMSRVRASTTEGRRSHLSSNQTEPILSQLNVPDPTDHSLHVAAKSFPCRCQFGQIASGVSLRSVGVGSAWRRTGRRSLIFERLRPFSRTPLHSSIYSQPYQQLTRMSRRVIPRRDPQDRAARVGGWGRV